MSRTFPGGLPDCEDLVGCRDTDGDAAGGGAGPSGGVRRRERRGRGERGGRVCEGLVRGRRGIGVA